MNYCFTRKVYRMNYERLIGEVIELLDKYDPEKHSVDSFTGDAARTLVEYPFAAQNFVIDTVYGCLEYHKLLDVVVNAFYAVNGRCLLKTDRNQFVVVCYLAMFHLEGLGLENFTAIVKSLDSSKMYKFLKFFFNVTNLTTLIHEEWSQIYDAEYVEHKWLAPLLRWQIEIEGLLDHQAKRLAKGTKQKKSAKIYTKTKEFDLSKPRPRSLVAPELIPQVDKNRPVPASMYRPPKELENLEEIKRKNFLEAQQVLYDAETHQFQCAKKPEKIVVSDSPLTDIEEQQFSGDFKGFLMDFEKAQLTSDKVITQQVLHVIPEKTKKEPMSMKLNKAAALREQALYDRLMEEELKRLDKLAQGGGEASAFLQWQREMNEKDLQVNLEHRKLEDKLRQLEVLQARQHVLESNQHKAQLLKEETAELMHRYAQKRLKEEKEMKELVQQVAEYHKNSKAAKLKLQKLKQQIVKEVSKESRDLLQQALDEAQAEMTRRFELICRIRAVESVPCVRAKFVDDTETGGHDLLSEMSLAELRERLARVQEEQRREQEEKHSRIQEERQHKEQQFQEQLERIALRRAAAKNDRLQKKEEKKQLQEKVKDAVKTDEKLAALQKKLDDIHSEIAKAKFNKEMADKAKSSISKKVQQPPLDEQYWLQLEQTLGNHVEKKATKMGPNPRNPK